MAQPPTLQLSASNRLLAGVCGGIGEHLNIDPTIVRIIFALLTVFLPMQLFVPLVYVVLWAILPNPS